MEKVFKKMLKTLYYKINHWLEKYLPVLMLVFILQLSFPHLTLAKGAESLPQLPLQAGRLEFFIEENTVSPSLFPEINLRDPQYTLSVWITAYNSHIAQTDSTPCITASGFNVCEHNQENIIATNFLYLPFGTKVRLPELFGDRVFTVEDRMNSRYGNTMDIWMKDFNQAKAFGRKYTQVEILPFVR